jgi:hypothetical protein
MRYFLITLFLFALSQRAAAYLDPGTGSMILQGIIAGLAITAFTIKSYWYKVRGFFGKAAPKVLLDEDEEPSKPEKE